MIKFESVLLWAAIFTYMSAFIIDLAAAVFRRPQWDRPAWVVIIAAWVFQTTSITLRWINIGHPPVVGRYENNLAGAWFVMLVFVILAYLFPRTKALGIVVAPVVLIMLGFGVMSGAELSPLGPQFKSSWIWVHVTFAWLAYSSFVAAGGLGLVYLLKDRRADEGEGAPLLRVFPKLEVLRDIIIRTVLFGFISQSLMLISGAIWANNLWGNYWSWDPLETWSLVTWLIYGIILHFRLTLGWKGVRIAWLVLGAIAAEIITFWGIGFISDLHTRLL